VEPPTPSFDSHYVAAQTVRAAWTWWTLDAFLATAPVRSRALPHASLSVRNLHREGCPPRKTRMEPLSRGGATLAHAADEGVTALITPGARLVGGLELGTRTSASESGEVIAQLGESLRKSDLVLDDRCSLLSYTA